MRPREFPAESKYMARNDTKMLTVASMRPREFPAESRDKGYQRM